MIDKKKVIHTIALVIVLLVVRYIFSVFVVYLLPQLEWKGEMYGTSYLPPSSVTHTSIVTNAKDLWNKWDSAKYIDIAQNGYEQVPFETTRIHNWAFYPLYPTIINFIADWFSYLKNTNLVFMTGIIISAFFFSLSLLILKKILHQLGIHEENYYVIVILLLTFPAGYFFHLFYPESLFLFLTLAFFYALFKKKYFYSSCILSLALITRPNAVALIIPFYVYFFVHEFKVKPIQTLFHSVIYAFFIGAPLITFYSTLSQFTGNFFAAVGIQKAWNNNGLKPFGYFISYFQTYGPTIRPEHILSFVFLIGISVLFFIIIVRFIKKWQTLQNKKLELIALFLYALGTIILMTSQTNLSSTFRHTVSNFSLFLLPVIFIPSLSNKKWVLAITGVSIVLQALFFILFLTGIPAYGF